MYKKISIGILMVCFSLIVTEVFLQLLVPNSLLFQTWFTKGVRQSDPRYGFVPTPSYQGLMSHQEGVFEVPIAFDENGFRPSVSSIEASQKKDVVLLGGMSMIFSYGLPQNRSLQAKLNSDFQFPNTVHNTAFPGLDLNRNFHFFNEKLGHKFIPSLVIISIYDLDRRASAWEQVIPPSFELSPPPSRDRLSHLAEGLLVLAPGEIGQALGGYYYKSAILRRTAHALDRRAPLSFRVSLARFIEKFVIPPQIETNSPEISETLNNSKSMGGYVKFNLFMNYLDEYFKKKGSRVVLLLLPIRNEMSNDPYGEISSHIPTQIKTLNLHTRLKPFFLENAEKSWIGGGHYSEFAMEKISKEIAYFVQD